MLIFITVSPRGLRGKHRKTNHNDLKLDSQKKKKKLKKTFQKNCFIYFNESPLNMVKNVKKDFYFILKILFVLKIFKFLY